MLNRRASVRHAFEERFELSWIFHENALDGTVLDPLDLKAALDHGTTEDEVLIATYQRIRNHKAALDRIRQTATSRKHTVTISFMKELHQLLCFGLPERSGGAYRKEIPIHRTYYHDILPPTKIAPQMNKLVRDLKSKDFRQGHPLVQASEFHFRFMQIFPFDDDTGKVGRLMFNYYLLGADYLPVIIPDYERQRYYDSLRASPKVLHDLMLECIETTLNNSLRLLASMRR